MKIGINIPFDGMASSRGVPVHGIAGWYSRVPCSWNVPTRYLGYFYLLRSFLHHFSVR